MWFVHYYFKRCHAMPPKKENPRRYEGFMVAPAGIEPASPP